MFPLLALLAMAAELAVGYPTRLYSRIGHPVTWMGRLIAKLDRRLNLDTDPVPARRRAGLLALVTLLATVLAIGLPIHMLSLAGPLGMLASALLASSLLAQRSLAIHVRAVADALETNGLAAGRRAVAEIVGRDPDRLDESGVCRAAIESLAENFSDGVVAPTIWLALAGVPGGLAYKAINTADSMTGHRTERYEAYGRAAARMDDLVNLPASRLSGVLLMAAAALIPGTSFHSALCAVRHDASAHRSPNAGWPEAAMAGALGISLAGPRHYGGVLAPDQEMNRGGRRDLKPSDVRRSLILYWAADMLLFLVAAIVTLAAWR